MSIEDKPQMKKIRNLTISDALLDLLQLSEFDGLPNHIKKSSNGLLFKKERRANKATQEYFATIYARLLLPETLRIPEIWGVHEDCLISRYYASRQFNRNSKVEAYQAADYLIEMHEVKVSNELRELLIEKSYCHYWGEALKNRLKQELEFSAKAFERIQSLQKYLIKMKAIVQACLDPKNLPPVLGHGDFHAKNLLFFENTIIPVDWIDFGVCERGYEVHHFVNSISSQFRDEIYSYYLAETEISSDELEIGGGIDALVQAGNRARLIISGQKDSSDKEIQEQFVSQIIRGATILKA